MSLGKCSFQKVCYKVIIVDGVSLLALKCVRDGIVSAFKSTIEDEKGSGIKHSEEESSLLWRRYACVCGGSCGRSPGGEGICHL